MPSEEKNDVMKYESVLPENFTGVFYFTNWTDEEFIGVWGKVEYHFPAQSMAPMVMPYSPLEVQNIRKKFAKDLAEREFFKSKGYGVFQRQERNNDGSPRLNSIHQAGQYSLDDLAPFIQRCLEPLPVQKAGVTIAPVVDITDKLSRNDDGELNSEAIDRKASLKDKALGNS